MSPPEAGASEGAPLLSSPSLSSAGGDPGVAAGVAGDGGGGDGSKEAGEPALVNVARLEARASTLWNVPNILTMARVIAIPVREKGRGGGAGPWGRSKRDSRRRRSSVD